MDDNHRMYWKKLVVGAASFGAGFAVVVSIIAGLIYWYNTCPKTAHWEQAAIIASYDGLLAWDQGIVFYYTLENKTKYDYTLEKTCIVAAKLLRQNSLASFQDDVAIEQLVFIPAHQRARVSIKIYYPTRPQRSQNDTDDKYEKKLSQYLNSEIANLNGFMLFDNKNEYQIDLPKGW